MTTENFNKPQAMFRANLNSDSVRIKIVGVGGAGNNALDRMQLDNVSGVRLAAINTDAKALDASPIEEKVLIGARSVTRGLSAGGEAELGKKAALTDRDAIAAVTSGSDLIFLVGGLGGGTGSGAMPVVAEVAKDQGALIIAFVTLPFTSEGSRRQNQAKESIIELRKYCNAVIPLPNDVLLQDEETDTMVLDAFGKIDTWICRGVLSLCTMLSNTGLINLDFTALKNAFEGASGKTLFGLGRGEGEDFVRDALNDLFMCPLLHLPDTAVCADRLLVNIIGGTDLSISKVNEILELVTEKFKSSDNTVLGAVIDEQKQSSIEICVIGTTDLSGHKKEVADKPAAAVTQLEIESDRLEDSKRVVHESKLGMKKAKAKKVVEDVQNEFEFVDESQQRGFFHNTEANMYNDQDLDVPTYFRKGIKVVLT